MGAEAKKIEELEKKEKDLEAKVAELKQKQKEIEEEKANKLSGAGQTGVVVGNRSDSFEAKLLRTYGRKSVRDLMEVNVNNPSFRHVPYDYKAAMISIKEHIDINRIIAQTIYGGAKDKSEDKPAFVKEVFDTRYAKEELLPMLKAFDTASHPDWLPETVTSSYIDEFELEKQVPGLFREIRMNSNPFNLSVKTSNTVAKIVAELAALPADSFTTGKIVFDATKLAEHFPISTELDEDSAVDMLRIAREELTESQVRAKTEIIINGDDTATHMDNDTALGAANLAQKAQKGLRKLALDNSANGSVVTVSSGMTVAKLDEMRTAMGKFGVQVRDLCYVVSPTVYHQMVNLDEVSSVDQVGNAATLLTGALAFFRGIPIVIAEQVREDVSATGVNTNAGPNDKGVAHLVNKRRFFSGIRRPIRLRVMMDLPDQDRWLLSSLQRYDFKGHAQDAGEVSSVLAIDVVV